MSPTQKWIQLVDRTDEIKEAMTKLIRKVNSATQSSFSEQLVYDDYGWGQFESSYLYRALMMMQRETVLLDNDEIIQRIPVPGPVENEQTNGVFQDEGDEIELPTPERLTRSLNWFRSASQDQMIRDQARNEYEQRLMALYVEHVESTGETFYPELQSILINEYDFTGDS